MNSSLPIVKKIARYKQAVDQYSLTAFEAAVNSYQQYEWSQSWVSNVRKLIPAGKGLRAGLMIEMVQALDKTVSVNQVVPLASALELVQTALLIQDDIMDKDLKRRGQKTLHISLADQFKASNLSSPAALGESVAYCMSDLLFFCVFLFPLGENPMPFKAGDEALPGANL